MELIIDKLSKNYGKHTALQDITLSSGPGLLGLLGSNGAGKTTLMRIIATRLKPSGGCVSWNGHDSQQASRELRAVLGYLPQDFGVYPEFTARQFLSYLAALKGVEAKQIKRQVSEVLEMVDLERHAERKLGSFSGGMKQRVGIAQALLNNPQLLIVDEPTSGLDPEQRVHFRTLLSKLTTNRLVILSTHIIGDIEAVATKLALIKGGRIFIYTTPEDLIHRAQGQIWDVTVDSAVAQQLQTSFQVSRMLNQAKGMTLRLISSIQPHPAATVVEPTLEDACLLVMSA